ncbi:hypothetical protein PA10_00070 [Pseudomonas phage pPa_SNUABM_DT01]|nr:hypothetical protein PA10_00070 [Pseudomonas phage pPa_SNUABM_DT01]
MYEYQGALVKHRKPDVRFEEKDVKDIAVKTLLRDYAEVYLTLTHPSLEGKHTLVLTEVADRTGSLLETTTVAQWLVDNGNLTLPTHEGIPFTKTSVVMARDAWMAGYRVDRCIPNGSPFNDAIDSDKTDIWLTRDDTDYVDVQRHCLGTVNGLFHRVDADNDGVYLKDGGITFRKTQNALVGLVSFKNIGRVHTASITPDMVYNPDITKRYSDNFYLKVPFDTSNKVMGIVIGGYLHLHTNDIQVIGGNAMKVRMNKIPFLDRYMVSRYLIDQSSMERFHEVSATNELDYDLQGFLSNECMLELLTLSQSFIVGIEVDHLTTKVFQTSRTHLPGRFYHDQRPLLPLRTQLGLMPSYISEEENGVWVIRVDNNLQQHRFMNTRDYSLQPKVDEKRISSEPETLARGELVQWATHTVEIKVPEVQVPADILPIVP